MTTNNLVHINLASAKENTQRYRITLSANSIKVLEALALTEINTIGIHSREMIITLKELYLAASKVSSKIEVGYNPSYTVGVKVSIEEQLGLSSNELENLSITNSVTNSITKDTSNRIKSESELLMAMSEEDRNKVLAEFQAKLLQEMKEL